MGRQIVKQPNGKYCIYSSIVDNITYYNMTKDEIIEVWTSEEKKKIEKRVNQVIEELEHGGKPYFQFTKSYKDLLETVKNVHGKEEKEKINSLMVEIEKQNG